MISPAAASGFVVLLLCVPVVTGQDGWGVTFSSTEICAVKGSTVEMSCSYKHPDWISGYYFTVQETFWFIKDSVDLTTDEAYTHRVESSCHEKRCTLRIRDLRKSDSAFYKFRFTTNPPNAYSSPTGVTLAVTDLHVDVSTSYYGKKTLTCRRDCRSPDHLSYVWYKNGRDIRIATRSHSAYFQDRDSVSCALRGFEDFPSASVCIYSQSCNKVTYNQKRICAVRGSSAVISCTYQSYGSTTSFWFSPQQSHRWLSSSKPEVIREDSQYRSRVQVNTDEGRSILTISNLRDTDAAEYRFKFKTSEDEWGSDLHGTTLTVLAFQVLVTRKSDYRSYFQLKCVSSCIPSGVHSYVWFKNGRDMNRWTSSIERWFDLGDRISCALKTYQQHKSPEVYAPQIPSVLMNSSGDIMEGSFVNLTCSSDANPAANHTWYKRNGNPALSNESQLIFRSIRSSDSGLYYCTAENVLGKRTSEYFSIDVKYAPKLPSVSVNPSAEIVEGSSVNLTCSSDANPAASCTWYKENQKLLQGQRGNFNFPSISSGDRGTYYCRCENKYRQINSTSTFIDVQYAPKFPSVSVNPSVEVMEGGSVNLTCSSDANPAASCTWYKENQTLHQGQQGNFNLPSISSGDRGTYYCRCGNEYGQINSTSTFIDVQYAPNLPSVRASSPGEIMEGSSVNLTCSSDANPAANYTWYKENEVSPKASGQTFTITNATPKKHSGKYYCEARNTRGHQKSSLDLIIVAGPLKSAAVGSITVIVLVIVFLSAFLLIRRQWFLRTTSESRENPDNTAQDADPEYDNPSAAVRREPAEQQDDLYYSSVRFCKKQEDPLYSNVMLARPNKQEEEEEEEDVEYSAVNFNNGSPGRSRQESVENPSAVYSTVNKIHRR